MKKIYTILLLAFLFGFNSCSDDDDKKDGTTRELVGVWELQDISLAVLETTNSDIEQIAKDLYREISMEFDEGDTVEFFDDGTTTLWGQLLRFSVDKDNLTMKDGEGNKLDFTFSISGSKLYLTLDMKVLLLDSVSDELDSEELAFLKKSLKKFKVEFYFQKED